MKHSPPNPFLPGRALVLAVLPFVAVTPVAWAGDYYFNPANGVYGSNSDWRVWNGSTWVVPGTSPGTSDNAFFGWLNSSQTLGFSANYNVGTVEVLNGSATFNLNSHSWNVTNGFNVGDGYSATANVSGGTVNAGSLLLGYSEGNAGVNGVFNLANATFNTSASYYTVIGYDAGGTANINSGGVLGSGAAVYVGFNAGSTGTLNINSGGTVIADYVGKGSGSGTLNFNGGTLRARSGDYANFFYGFATGDVQIQSGGAIIDSNGFNIATSTGLRGSGSLTKQGSGTLTLTGASSYSGDTLIKGGALQVSSGGTLSNAIGYVGFGSGNTGAMTVTGSGSQWTNSGVMEVGGGSANGTLLIQSGGKVTDTTGYIAYDTGTTSTATVTGTGSQWSNSDAIVIGNNGNGTLNIQSGGSVTNTNIGFIGYNSTGTVTVNGTGSLWNNGTTTRVGLYGNGTLNIQSGGTVTDTGGYIGYYSGSIGATTVDGAGSQWNNSLNLYVGDDGRGTLTIQNGGKVTNSIGYIGNGAGTGTTTVTGAGSQWINSGELNVGYSGSGTLNIQNGGVVSNTFSYIGRASGGSGTVTVTGAGSQWTNTSPDLVLGSSGTGTLSVDAGGKVTAPDVIIALAGSGKGTLNLNGTSGSRGVLETAFVSEGSGTGGGTINFNGGILRATADSSDFLQNLEATDVQVQSGGAFIDTNGHNVTVNSIVQFNGTGGIDKQGAGTLTLSGNRTYNGNSVVEGGTLANTIGYVGNGSTSTMTVTGIGSQWSNSSELHVGESGNGTLNVQNGGKVTNAASAVVGYNNGSTGVVTVSGSGSQWINNTNLYIGYSGNGTLNVQSGGTASSPSGRIGFSSGSTGMAAVSGAGSQWTNSGVLFVGVSGSGTLTVDAAGKVTASGIFMANSGAGAAGTLNLNGATGSRGVLETVSISEGSGSGGGHINFNGGILRATADSSDFLQSFEAGDVQIQNGGAFIDSNGYNVTIGTALQGSGGLTKQGAGTLTLTGTQSYTGPTTVNQGRLAVNGNISTSITTVNSGGTLGGSGTVGAVTVTSGGALAAGNSIESLATGNLTLSGGSNFAYEMNNDAASGAAGDLTVVNGTLDLSLLNDANLSLAELGSGSWSLGEKLTLISYSGAWNGGLFQLGGGTLADDSTFAFSGMDWRFNYNDTTPGSNWLGDLTSPSYVTMTAVPEPGSLLLIGCSSFALLRRRRIPNH